MLTTFAVSDAASAASVIAEKVPKGLAQRVYQALLIPAIENAKERGYVNASRVTFHCPAEIISTSLGISRMSLWRAVQVLRDAGLVDARTQKARLSCRGGAVRNTGSVWQVRLTPNHGSKCKLSYEELKHSWRPNFNDEVRRGAGSHAAVKAARSRNVTYKSTLQELDLDLLLKHSVDSKKHLAPVDSLVCNKPKNAVLEVLLDVTAGRRGQDTVQRVDMAALALATGLADHGSVNFYRRLVWGCLRASEKGTDHFQTIYQMAIRARVDRVENFSRRGGALFVSRLKDTRIWDEIMRSP
jgi:biotin operon repressor